MKVLKGDVDILGLGNLLQSLAMYGGEGVLTVFRGTNKKSIHFIPGVMTLRSTTMRHINRVGHILVKKRKISASDLKDLLAEQRLLGWKFGHIAVDSGKVAKQDLEDALKEQIQEEINDMFLWSDAQFEFVQGPPESAADSPLSEVAYTQNLSSLILEAAYHADEILALRQMFETDNVIMGQTGKPIPSLSSEDGEAAHGIYGLVNGKRTIREIEHDSIYPRTATLRALNLLLNAGCIRRLRSVNATDRKPPVGHRS